MELTYFGVNCLLITTKQLQIVVDPFGDSYGLKLPSLKSNVILYSTPQPRPIEADSFIVDSPGEYEMKNVLIQGVVAKVHSDDPQNKSRGIMYTITAGGVRLLVTGNITPELEENQLEAIGDIDILVVPVGGKGLTLDAQAAAQVVTRFEPSFVIPIHYNDGATKYPIPQDEVESFLKEVGGEASTPMAKLKITPKELGEETKVVLLERQSR